MSNRHLARTLAMQSLYEWDFNGKTKNIADLLSINLHAFAPDFHDNGFTARLLEGVLGHISEIDDTITTYAPEWPIDQITVIDRNVLRIGIYELVYSPEVPPRVAINEAIELAKTFGGDSSGKFVNGVLGAIYKKMEEQGVKKIPEEVGAGGVVYRRATQGILLLMIRDPYNRWTFPKGHREEGEELADTALRETREEVGLTALVIKELLGTVEYTIEKPILNQVDKPAQGGNQGTHKQLIQKTVTYFLMEGQDEALTVDTSEKIKEARWVTLDEAREFLGYENNRKVLDKAIQLLNG